MCRLPARGRSKGKESGVNLCDRENCRITFLKANLFRVMIAVYACTRSEVYCWVEVCFRAKIWRYFFASLRSIWSTLMGAV